MNKKKRGTLCLQMNIHIRTNKHTYSHTYGNNKTIKKFPAKSLCCNLKCKFLSRKIYQIKCYNNLNTEKVCVMLECG